jgi:hypothetical protein
MIIMVYSVKALYYVLAVLSILLECGDMPFGDPFTKSGCIVQVLIQGKA